MKFRMVDRIVSWEARRSIAGVKTVSFEEYGLKQRLGDDPHLPEMLVLESCFQLANWLIVLSSDFAQCGLLVRTERVSFDARLGPGERLCLDVRVRRYRHDGMLFDGRAWVGTRELAAGVGCLAVPVELSAYYDPDDMRVLFSEIYQPQQVTAP